MTESRSKSSSRSSFSVNPESSLASSCPSPRSTSPPGSSVVSSDDALDGYIRNNYPKSIITILDDGYLKAVKEILYTIAKFVEEYSSEVIN